MMTPCGRPTKSGGFCRQPGVFEGLDDKSCHVHATLEDRKVHAKLQEAWKKGYREGRAVGREQEVAETAIAERESGVAANTKYIHSSGAKIVQVGRYTYLWSGREDLAVGDEVVLPAGWSGDVWIGEVTALGSDYVGPMKSIISKA